MKPPNALRLAVSLAAVLFALFALTGCRAGIVTHVVDGDTVDVDGIRVRVIGIDTPERGATLPEGQSSVDIGTIMIGEGYAFARYDSLDGYDRHPMQDQYRALDAQVKNICK